MLFGGAAALPVFAEAVGLDQKNIDQAAAEYLYNGPQKLHMGLFRKL